jgi:hypothetical protein
MNVKLARHKASLESKKSRGRMRLLIGKDLPHKWIKQLINTIDGINHQFRVGTRNNRLVRASDVGSMPVRGRLTV